MFERNKDGVVILTFEGKKRALAKATKHYYEQTKRQKKMADKSRKINRKD